MPLIRYGLRQNFLAIFVAALACLLLEAIWAAIFVEPWLNGIGRNRIWLNNQSVSPVLQVAAALFSAVLIATTIEVFTRLTGPKTAKRGVEVAFVLWLGLSLSTRATEYVAETRPFSLFAMNAGFWLIGMVVMGAIVGGWKKTGNRE